MKSYCGTDCTQCPFKEGCKGCTQTKGKPFLKQCLLAQCCIDKQQENCNQCEKHCTLKSTLIEEINSLNIEDMEKLTHLNALKGSFVNLAYTLPNGQSVQFLEDDQIYLGNQLHKENSDRCYGVVAHEDFILLSEYGCMGQDAHIVVYKKRT